MFLFLFDLCHFQILAATRARSFVVLFQCLQPCAGVVRSLKLAELSDTFNLALSVVVTVSLNNSPAA